MWSRLHPTMCRKLLRHPIRLLVLCKDHLLWHGSHVCARLRVKSDVVWLIIFILPKNVRFLLLLLLLLVMLDILPEFAGYDSCIPLWISLESLSSTMPNELCIVVFNHRGARHHRNNDEIYRRWFVCWCLGYSNVIRVLYNRIFWKMCSNI